MPLSRDPRLDRRRRVLRDSALNSAEESLPESRPRSSRSRRAAQDGPPEDAPATKRSAGYSQSVRKACQHRLVQFIPVRKRSLIAAVMVSVCLPALLLATHYSIFVSEWLPWKNHPVAAVLDASHPRSVAAWLSSQLWLLCLAATVLTFQLRRHKLDDYDGEYRLWFWLVLTCLIGSIDSTTRVTELLGVSLERWSQLHVGWSGGAIVQATLAALVGMLGLRLCSELKTVPTSLVLWLVGLTCWAGSATLSQSLFKIDLSYQFRIWLRAGLWLAGLTSIWVAALFYLRSVYIEAQRRFILRGKLMSAASVPLRERLARALPAGPFFRHPKQDPNQPEPETEASEYAKVPRGSRSSNLLRIFRKSAVQTEPLRGEQPTIAAQPTGSASSSARVPIQVPVNASVNPSRLRPIEPGSTIDDIQDTAERPRRSWFGRGKPVQTGPRKKRTLLERFTRRRSAAESAPGLGKHDPAKQHSHQYPPTIRAARQEQATDRKSSPDQSKLPKKRRLRVPTLRLPKLRFPKLRFPRLRLPSFRLPPPTVGNGTQQEPGVSDGLRSVNSSTRRLPGTGPSSSTPQTANTPQGESYARSMSKAERKKLKRLGRDDDPERRAA